MIERRCILRRHPRIQFGDKAAAVLFRLMFLHLAFDNPTRCRAQRIELVKELSDLRRLQTRNSLRQSFSYVHRPRGPPLEEHFQGPVECIDLSPCCHFNRDSLPLCAAIRRDVINERIRSKFSGLLFFAWETDRAKIGPLTHDIRSCIPRARPNALRIAYALEMLFLRSRNSRKSQ